MVYYEVEIRAKTKTDSKTEADTVENEIIDVLKQKGFKGFTRMVRYEEIEIENTKRVTQCEIHIREI